ncbi:hypothetical protein RRG08_000209 [Elysia crispata]|uniref:Uncharacterized protein n=1 Tax=Elysia crispata TaxID=231223 RepID=A0AAE0YW22_9GAST|nr:hypothetical protein RRG08_000209 [Elysia crispata]
MASETTNTAFRNAGFDPPDVVVIIIFIIFCLLVGIWCSGASPRPGLEIVGDSFLPAQEPRICPGRSIV